MNAGYEIVDYGAEQIKTLEGIEAIRLRPGMYIGSIGPKGVSHITLEIISNAIDEYLNGYCNLCRVYLYEDGYVSIADNGRGIPTGLREDGMETLEAVFTVLHTGAKFDSDGKTGYNTSGGMNGVGAKATNALSEEFIVEVQRGDGKHHKMIFNKGKRVSYDITNADNNHTGTIITFKPDAAIFKEGIDLDYDSLKKQILELSFLSQGMTFELNKVGSKYKEVNSETNMSQEIIKSENGLLDYLDYLNKGTSITKKFYCETKEDRIGVKVGLIYNNSYTENYKLYTNSIPNTSGTHLTGFRTALTSSINDYARKNNLLKEKDENLTGSDLQEGLVMVLSLVMPDPVFDGQTKEVLTSSEGRTVVQRLVSQEIKIWLENNPSDAKAIIQKALLSKRARDAAKKARETTRKKNGSVLSSVLPGKLADCISKKPEECEIFIVEGDSAGGSAKTARNRKTQAILPLRGKPLNVWKCDLAKALSNEEIKAMITAFGLTHDGKKVIFDESKLRYHKIIMMADADVDGSHIQTLLLTFIWKFAPELIQNGYVYAAVPPLYKVIKGKESIYLLNDAALEEYKRTHASVGEVSRFKGLGEMSAEQLAETTMDPETRILKQITVDDVEEVGITVEKLMGTSPEKRKAFIQENAYKANVTI